MDLFSKEAVLQQLQSAGIWSKKALGQHFLIDQTAIEAIVQAAELHSDDMVVEIGPGMGVLSQELLSKVQKVVSFEYDPEMIQFLRKNLPALEVISGDVLQTAAEKVSQLQKYKLVANIPYQITSPILRLFLEGGIQPVPESLTLLIQKEVGERLAAAPRKPGRSYLSILAQYYAEVSYVKTVPASSFWPAPKIDSAIIHLAVRSSRSLDKADEQDFLRFVRTLFNQPRKQLKNVLAGIRGTSTQEVEQQFATLGLPSTVRAQELSMEDWLRLYKERV